MHFSVKSGSPEKQRGACLVVGMHEPRHLSDAAKALDTASDGALGAIVRRGDHGGQAGETLMLHNLPGLACERVLLVGLGKKGEFHDAAYRKACAAAASALDKSGATEAVSYLADLPLKGRDTYWKASQAVVASASACYRFDETKNKKEPPKRPLKKLTLALTERAEVPEGERGLRDGQAIANGMALAQRLGNLPGNICTPTFLAEQARELGKAHRKLKVDVLEEKDMEKLGMGALLSVARGSRQPAKLIVMHYKGAARDEPPVVLVGKGVTFDSGGISLKPGAAMDEMKFDMCGAAGVMGTLQACCELELPLNLVVIVPATENLPDGLATKPGDVVTSMSGQTIEILNTDAEGRLILCDALSYAARFEPSLIIDVATLTGACVVALGKHASGLLGNHEPLIHALLKAGQASGDRAWQLPLWEEYQEQLKSNFADMANIGGPQAGTITAACFLSRFTRDQHWAHLDIAGVAWKQGEQKGATGRPVPLLTRFLLDRIESR
ncbi:MAG: leucyl aminopeptidase [Gammaproteobacteria bacterium]|nr:leucyl aminopeptidase [Gammaproteobacteria bacterium]